MAKESAYDPVLFGYGRISTEEFDSHPAFMPDGKTVYFVRSTPNFNLWTIVYSTYSGREWSEPQIAPFSGQYSDADPFITKDGRRLYFISRRPAPGKTARDLDIWFTDKKSDGTWSEPMNLGEPINSIGNEWYPTISGRGVLYFGSDRPGGLGATDLYRSRLTDGRYSPPENLGAPVNSSANEFEPLASEDESYLIFMAGGRAESRGGFDLYLSNFNDGKWSTPRNLGDKINSPGNEYSPTISPDGRCFFWTSTRSFSDRVANRPLDFRELMRKLRSPQNGLGDIYQIGIDALEVGK